MKKLNIIAAKELKKEKDKYQCEVDKIYKELIEDALDGINEQLVNALNNLISDTLDKLVSHDSTCFTGLIGPDLNIDNDGGFSIKIYPRFGEDTGQKLHEIFSNEYLNKTVVLKSDLGDFEGKIITDNARFAQDTIVLMTKGSVCDMLMQSFKDAGYHVELVTDENNRKSIRVSL